MDNRTKINDSESKNEGKYEEDIYISKQIDNQLLKKYIHDIRNSHTFSRDILIDINNLSYEDRLKILLVYNEMMSYYLSLLENL